MTVLKIKPENYEVLIFTIEVPCMYIERTTVLKITNATPFMLLLRVGFPLGTFTFLY